MSKNADSLVDEMMGMLSCWKMPADCSNKRKAIKDFIADLREWFAGDYDGLLTFAAVSVVFKAESEAFLQELTEMLIRHKRLLEQLESGVVDGDAKAEIITLLQTSNPMGKLLAVGKNESERQSATRRSEIASAAAVAKIGKHLETKGAIKTAYLSFLADGGKEKKRFISEQAELHAKGESAIRSYITEWNKELKNQSA